MRALTGKTLALWLTALFGWLCLGALLGASGVPAVMLLALNLAATGAVLWRIARGTVVNQANGFLIAYREEPSALTPHAIAAVWISGFGTVGVGAAILVYGHDAFALVAGLVGGGILTSLLIAPALADSGAVSLPEWLIRRFGAGAGWFVKGSLALSGLAVIVVQLAFAALVGQAMFGLPSAVLLPFVAVLVLLAMLGGGMGTMVPAQAVLFLILFVGVLVPALWLGISETGIIVPHFAPGALLHEGAVAEGRLGVEAGSDPFAAMMLGLTVLLGTLAMPHALVRYPSERDGRAARYHAQRSTLLAVAVIAAVPLFAIAVRSEQLLAALAAGVPLPADATPVEAIAQGIATLAPPAWLLAMFGAGTIAALVATSASATLLVAGALGGDPRRETAGGVLARFRWVATGTVIVAMLVALTLPVDPVTAFFALMAFAASAFLAPLILSLMWLRLTSGGALAGVFAGAALCTVLGAFGWSATGGVAVAGFTVSTLAAVLVSLIRSNPEPSPPLEIPPRT